MINPTLRKKLALLSLKLKADAEAYLGTEINQVVNTCPAYLPMYQLAATKDVK